jgi:hypothetical protein
MAEVEPRDIHSGLDQRPDGFVSSRGRTEGTDDLPASIHV